MDLGTRLKDARQGKGLTIEDVAAATRIPKHLLESIDANDFARLPGGLITRAYLRAYASRVGLDAERVVDEYRSEGAPEPDDCLAKLQTLYSVREGHRTDWRLVAGFAALLAVLAGIARIAGPPEPGNPAAAVPLAADETVGPASLSGSPANRPVDDFGFEELAPVRLDLEPRAPCWVSAIADGRPVIYRLLQPGERASVEAWRQIDLLVGDAAACSYSINGAPGRPLGRPAQVVTVTITADDYRDFIEEAAH